MIFEKYSSRDTKNLKMTFSGQTIERVQSFKYLGLFFSRNLSFSDHVKYVLIKAEKAAFMYWKYIGRFISLNTSIQLNLYSMLLLLPFFFMVLKSIIHVFLQLMPTP